MTTDLTKAIINPAWDYVSKVPNDYGFGFSHSEVVGSRFIGHRSRVTATWAWAIPSPESLLWIVEQLDGRALVEVGAGNGYWAWCLWQLGVDVNAYDRAPVGAVGSWFNDENLQSLGGDWPYRPAAFFPVEKASVEALERPENHDRALFLCWPDYDSDFAFDALTRFRGDMLIYIGEDEGGCNGNWRFHELIGGSAAWDRPKDEPPYRPEWTHVETGPMAQWSGMHDNLTLYRRLT